MHDAGGEGEGVAAEAWVVIGGGLEGGGVSRRVRAEESILTLYKYRKRLTRTTVDTICRRARSKIYLKLGSTFFLDDFYCNIPCTLTEGYIP
jgi:hypothetical protein